MAVNIQEIRHFVMALTLSFEYGFTASLDFIEARRSSWALSLWGLSGIPVYSLLRPHQGPRRTYGTHLRGTVYSVLRTHQGLTEGGLGGVGGKFLIRKTLPKVTESNENRHLDLGDISMFSDT